MAETTENEGPIIEIGEKVKVLDGEYKGEEGSIINVYNNTVAVEFNNIHTKDGSKFRTVIKHGNYKSLS